MLVIYILVQHLVSTPIRTALAEHTYWMSMTATKKAILSQAILFVGGHWVEVATRRMKPTIHNLLLVNTEMEWGMKDLAHIMTHRLIYSGVSSFLNSVGELLLKRKSSF